MWCVSVQFSSLLEKLTIFPGKCLERPNGGLSEGTPVLVYKRMDNNTNQIWTS